MCPDPREERQAPGVHAPVPSHGVKLPSAFMLLNRTLAFHPEILRGPGFGNHFVRIKTQTHDRASPGYQHRNQNLAKQTVSAVFENTDLPGGGEGEEHVMFSFAAQRLHVVRDSTSPMTGRAFSGAN